jgi:tRNA pseudouridine38-40 synthase
MPRYRLLIEYDGGPYQGWQAQPHAPSVQGALEAAFLAFSGERVSVRGAGRTDAGVHAAGQVAHVDLTRDVPPARLREAVNAHLRPQPVAVLEAARAAPDFDARFSARRRVYRYLVLDRRAPPALRLGRVWHVVKPLDEAAMHRAAQALVGRHDFTSFRNADCQAKSPVRTLDRLAVSRVGGEVAIDAEARSFLHNQVRSMVGCLKRVGEGVWAEERVAEALAARNRAACAAVAPPQGLYLMRVDYPPSDAGERDGGASEQQAQEEIERDHAGGGGGRRAERSARDDVAVAQDDGEHDDVE